MSGRRAVQKIGQVQIFGRSSVIVGSPTAVGYRWQVMPSGSFPHMGGMSPRASPFPSRKIVIGIRSHRALNAKKIPLNYFSLKFLISPLFRSRDYEMEGDHIFRKRLYTAQELDVSSRDHQWSRKLTRMLLQYAATNEPFENTITFYRAKFSLRIGRIPMKARLLSG